MSNGYRDHPIQLLKHADIDKENTPKELLGVQEEIKASLCPDTTADEEGTPAVATLAISALLTEEPIRLLTSASGETTPPPPLRRPLLHHPSESVSGLGPGSGHTQSITSGTASGTSGAPSDRNSITSASFEFIGRLNLAGGLQDYSSPPTSPGKAKRNSLKFGRRVSLDKCAKQPSSPIATPAAGCQTICCI